MLWNPLAQLRLRGKLLATTSLLSALTVLVGLLGLSTATSVGADLRAVNESHTKSLAILADAARTVSQIDSIEATTGSIADAAESLVRTMVSTFKLETEEETPQVGRNVVTARRRAADWQRPAVAVAGRSAR